MVALFVAVEGGEGAGKSTQISRLAAALGEQGHDVVVTREPGGTPAGEAVRAILLDPSGQVAPRAEALLFAAARAQHVAQLIRPALARGAVVVTDRYVDSSLAYQGAGRVLDVAEVEGVNTWATEGLLPDLTVVLDVDPVVGLARAGACPDRLEAEPLDFHRRVRQGFLDLAARDPDRYLVLDADRDPEDVAREVRAAVAARLRERAEVAP